MGLFVREGSLKRDPGGNPTATYRAGRLILLDTFYYQTYGHSFTREFGDCRDYVKIAHPNARLVSDEPSRLHPGARRATFSFDVTFLGGPKTKVISELLFFRHRDRFLKFRVTYPSAHAERARQEIDSFVRAFPLP